MNELDDAYMAAWARISYRIAQLSSEHHGWSIEMCIHEAMLEEIVLYGVPGEQAPVGILGKSPIQSIFP